MHEYLFEADLVRFAFILGIIVSVSLYDRFHIATGIILPGYLGLFILQPVHLLITFATGVLIYWLVHRLLPRYLLMYSCTKFFTCISVSVGLQVLFLELSRYLDFPWGPSPILVSIGFVIPAIIAHDMSRNGIWKTLGISMGAGTVVAIAILLTVALIPSLYNQTTTPTSYGSLAFGPNWLPTAIFLSVLASAAIQHSYRLRAGGFIGVAYLSLVVVNPVQIIFLLAVAAITYLIVVRLVIPHQISFGRRNFATMMLVGALISWGSLLAAERLFGYSGLIPHWMILPGLFLPGLFANDTERVGISRVLRGTGLCLLFTLCATLLVIELAGERRLYVVLLLAGPSVAAGSAVFARYIRASVFALRSLYSRRSGVPNNPPAIAQQDSQHP